MSTRLTVLLAATAMAVAMLAVAGMAWAQQDSVEPVAADDPKISPISPNPGSETGDRTPTIKAKVTDNDHDLEKRDIKLYLDGDRVRNFDYSRGRNVLDYTPKNNLSFGKHTVKVVAVAAQGEKATERWSFKVER